MDGMARSAVQLTPELPAGGALQRGVTEDPYSPFFEKQSRMLCGVHALNNLLQCSFLSKDDVDVISSSLPDVKGLWNSWFLHKTPILG